MQAIETIYNDYRFRSRLEARWAIFFDALGVEYTYEPEGYDLGENGYYLPDFWLPKLKLWVEIKPEEATMREILCARGLADLTRQNVVILQGQPSLPLGWFERMNVPNYTRYNGLFLYENFDRVHEQFTHHHFDSLMWFLRDKGYDIPDYDETYEAAVNMIEIDKQWHLKHHGKPHRYWHKGPHFDRMVWQRSDRETVIKPACSVMIDNYNLYDNTFAEAYKLARMARFEHGQKPQVYRVNSHDYDGF